jgi:hypothetical protein
MELRAALGEYDLAAGKFTVYTTPAEALFGSATISPARWACQKRRCASSLVMSVAILASAQHLPGICLAGVGSKASGPTCQMDLRPR